MIKLFTSMLVGLLLVSSVFASNGLDNVLSKYYQTNKVTGKNEKVDDYALARRLYIDLAGRIPTTDELKAYVLSQSPEKKNQLIDKLLGGEDYVNNFYNLFADMLRIRPERLSDSIGQLRAYPYVQYIRDSLREDRSYSKLVTEMMTAEGRITENPATGYLLRDNGMALDNLATSIQLFLGKNIACAQCHDDPFQDYGQKQYYELFAFFGSQENRMNRGDFRDIQKRIDEEIVKITGKERVDNNVRQLLSANLFSISENAKKEAKLPHDYQYDDAKPNDVVMPVSLDGKVKNVTTDRRKEFAEWVIGKPDFEYTIVNRIWKELIGVPLVTPMDNFDAGSSNEKLIIHYLGDYFKNNKHSLKTLIRHIVDSEFYSRVGYNLKIEDYKFQSPLVKRLSYAQIWDSVLTLVLDDPNYTRINFKEYSSLFALDFSEISGTSVLQKVEDLKQFERGLNDKFLKYKGIDLVRSSFLLNRSGYTGLFIKEFGASDRVLIDSTDDQGSLSQVLILMNSPLHDLISSDESQLMQAYNKESKNKEVAFVSILGRLPSPSEKSIIASTDIKDLTWALINTREFLFRK